MTDETHAVAIQAARKLGRCVFHVRHHDGTTLDMTPSEQVARSYLKGIPRGTHLIDIYKISPLGYQTLIHKAPYGGFLMADLCRVIYGGKK